MQVRYVRDGLTLNDCGDVDPTSTSAMDTSGPVLAYADAEGKVLFSVAGSYTVCIKYAHENKYVYPKFFHYMEFSFSLL